MSTRELELPAGRLIERLRTECEGERVQVIAGELEDALPAIRQQLYRELGERLMADQAVEAAAQGMFDLWSKPGRPTSTDRAEAKAALKAAWDSATGHSFDLGGEGQQ